MFSTLQSGNRGSEKAGLSLRYHRLSDENSRLPEWKTAALHFFDCTKYSMDAFTGKEQNRANVVPMMCQFEDANDCCRCCQQESKL